jgi:type II secretory pathway pseudopilin PulG
MKSGNNLFSFYKKKRGAIALSMNVLVILIISFVVLGMGITLLYKMVGGAIDKKAELDGRTQQELQRLLIDGGKSVALPSNIATIIAGDDHIFGIGVLNIDPVETEFKVDIVLDRAVDDLGEDFSSEVIYDQWLLYYQDFDVQNADHHIQPILVSIPGNAKKGKYIFNVKILKNSNAEQYGNTQKIIVTVR